MSAFGLLSAIRPETSRPDATTETEGDEVDLEIDSTETVSKDPCADAWFSLIDNPRRRFIIDQLRTGDVSSVGDLAHSTAAAVDTTYKSAYVSLHTDHLDVLEAAGVIRRGQTNSDPIRPGPEFATACTIIDSVRETAGPDHWASQCDTGGDVR